MQIKIVAEGGIAHGGDLQYAKKLIKVATFAGCDYIKWQKRTPELCVPESQKNKPKQTPWGVISYIDYKKRIEFGEKEYQEIYKICNEEGIECFASVWDIPSCDFMKRFTTIGKIPSALITNTELCQYARKCFNTLMVSTGMSDEEEIESCVRACDPDVIFHTNSTYPCPEEELNLLYIRHLIEKYPDKSVGYSGHEFGLLTTQVTPLLGVQYIERHICLNRTDWISDCMASVEPHGLIKLVKGIRNVEKALGTKGPRKVMGGELEKRKSLRGT